MLGGAVQDFVILCASMRRDGKSLGQIAKEEVNPVAGLAAMVAIFAIMIILLAVLALVVVNALRDSPWGLFTLSMTIPIALFMGWWINAFRPGKVSEATVIGIVLLFVAARRRTVGVAEPDVGTGIHVVGDEPLVGRHGLRVHRIRAASLVAAGAARLPLGVHEDRHDPAARCRDHLRDAAAQDAGRDAVRRRERAGVRGQAVSVRVHHDRLRRGIRLSRAHLERHVAEDAQVRA